MNWKKGVGVVIAIAIIAFIFYSVINSNTEEETITVQIAKVSQETIKETLSTNGLIESTQTQTIFGQGLIQDVPVSVGDSIEEGATLISYRDGTNQTADFNGTVTTVNAKNGQVDLSSQNGEPAIAIADLSNLQVTINLSESDAPLIEEGQVAVLTTGDQSFDGTVSHIDPTASTVTSQTSTSMVLKSIISFDTPPEGLFAGFNIDVDVTTNTAENVLAIPIEALLYDVDNNPYVYVVENEKALTTPIETGIQSATNVEVTDGLTLDDTIILSPDDTISDGTKVTSE
ncbi:efflux RND transporter periplasmic adaptor subunit [Carnobacterium pleistocenium]|uniref:efflux RND transporter periplasmic adaptor subunit n=1 Tax=Carnobacterium pleistocenium TaxID=181073 RepID=UPI00055925D9|nr:efflux RND transporter periplasmic adaptor subunit [Carnobacterium pleistocenium]